MYASKINNVLAQLSDDINNFEKTLQSLIECKRNRLQTSMKIKTIDRKLQHHSIAIIGMASLFPKAINLREYWQNIAKEVDCITFVPPSRWNVEDYYEPNPRTPDEKTYCRKGGFIPDVDFNPMEFGLPPSILEVTDVSQLLSLLVAKEAMEDAGYGEEREFNRDTVGVVLGVALARQLAIPLANRLQYPIWKKVLKSSGLSDEDTQKIVEKIKSAYVPWNENAFPGMLANIIAGRIANRLNLGGMNCVVDAACASSFGALKMAVSELVEHRCDMVLTGGVDTDNSIMAYMCFSKTPAISPSENIKPFDAKSDGMILGEGIGMVVLKRLEDAERDNDKIYAVIKGIGASSDGRSKSIYAPRKEGQVKALRRAYEDAGFSPESVSLIEAHGTGTLAGDRVEFTALSEFFGEQNLRQQQIALGSVKSQIGHTKAAAGAASLIKTALALHHKILPPTINVTQPNPKLNIDNSPFYLNTETRPWFRSNSEPPRRAGVSSFGFGGTNYHIVLEEYTAEQNRSYRLHHTPKTLLLFAPSSTQLLNRCEEILAHLQFESGDKYYLELVEECKSREIPPDAARVGFVVDSRAEACQFLQITIDSLKNKTSLTSWNHPQGIYYRAFGLDLTGKVVALFSGQGSQYLGMGREIAMNYPELRHLYSYMDSLLRQDNLQPVSKVVFPLPAFTESAKDVQQAQLQRTEYTQPALGVFSAGLYKILQRAGFKPDFIAGHSFGEITALWAAGVLSEKDFCFLVKARGQAMMAPVDSNYDAGTMLAVKEDIRQVEAVIQHFPQVKVANFNSPRQVVLAGKSVQIAKAQQVLHSQGATAVLLPVSAAFHTPLIIDSARKTFAKACKNVAFNSPEIPVYTNLTGRLYPAEPEAIQKNLENHLSNSVLFQQEIENIYSAGGYCFVEFGPRSVLTNLVKDILAERPHLAVALNPSSKKDSDRSLREAVVQLCVAGLPLKHIDPYEIPPDLSVIQQNKLLQVRLSSTNYVSEKTQNEFEKALHDGHQVQLHPINSEQTAAVDSKQLQPLLISPVALKNNGHNPQGNRQNGKSLMNISTTATSSKATHATTQEQPAVKPTSVLLLPAKKLNMPSTSDKQVNYQRLLESLEYLLSEFQQYQDNNLQLHKQYLDHQQEYTKTFFHLVQQQNNLFAKDKSSQKAAHLPPVVIDSLKQSMMQFHNHHSETLRIHEQYSLHQVEYTKNFFKGLQQEYSNLIVPNHTVQPVESFQVEVTSQEESPMSKLIEKSVSFELGLGLASETTNLNDKYEPALTLESPTVEAPASVNTKLQQGNQELVSKNGSPSIKDGKHVLTITQLETNFDTKLPSDTSTDRRDKENGREQEALAILENITEALPTLELSPIEILEQQSLANSTSTQITDIDLAQLSQNFLDITSDKTGYPVEMLELDMDMEADLGIDSIKRVEILAAMQELYPNLPQPKLEELAEKHTIRQIVDYIQSLSKNAITNETGNGHGSKSLDFETVSPSIATVTVYPETQASIGATLVQEAPAISTTVELPVQEAPAPPVDIDLAQLSQNFLDITSDKTGYPVEMLELDMDMEADLGIDSIKRVEILAAMQELYPNLPQPKLEELAEKHTIRQIVDYIQQIVAGEKKKLTELPELQPADQDYNIVRGLVKLKTLPQPDFLDFTLPEGHICLLTNDGSLIISKVAEYLIDQGWKVVVLSFPQSLIPQRLPLAAGVNRVVLADLSEEHLQQQLTAIATDYGSIGAFIHLNPVLETSDKDDISYLNGEKAIVKHVFLIAKHLKKSLNAAANFGRSCFCTVTRLDGAFGLEHKINFGPINGGLFGLTKSLRWEWQRVFCRAIDLSPTIDAEQSAHHIIAELHDPNLCIAEVAYGLQGRVTLINTADSKYLYTD